MAGLNTERATPSVERREHIAWPDGATDRESIDLRERPRGSAIRLEHDLYLISSRPWDASPTLKRAVDLVVATLLLMILTPVIALVALMVATTSRGGALFVQERVGRNGATFRCLKFRTMRQSSEHLLVDLLESDESLRSEWEESQKLTRDPRVTGVGRLLRISNLDELPQLLNVLAGQMSLIGPRPVVPEEKVRYGDDLTEVLSVRPGLSGLWQVSGRNNLSYEERIRLDLTYVRTQTLRTDVKIGLRTVAVVFQGSRSGAR